MRMIYVLGLALAGAAALAIANAGASGARDESSARAVDAARVAGDDDGQDLPPGHPPIDTNGAPPSPLTMDDGPDLPPGHPPIEANGELPAAAFMFESPRGGATAAVAVPKPKSIERAGGASGKTVAEIVAQAAKLAGTTVRVRGEVTKRTDGVLGKTWLHIADGGEGDLVVTTTDPVELGAVVLLEGRVATDRDLGSGYRYAVLLEDARVLGTPP